MSQRRRTYLALEGIEGSGKSTVAAAVAERLRSGGGEVVLVREPGGTSLGEEIRRLVLDGDDMAPWAEAALFAAQRAQLAAEVIGPALERGATVVSDRSFYSSIAYQGVGRSLGADAVGDLNRTVLDGIEPDLVVILDVDPQVGVRRQRRPDRIGSEDVSFLTAVRAGFRRLAMTDPDRVKLVDTTGEIGDVIGEVLRTWDA